MSPIVKKCTCAHKAQDEIYGKDMRLMNPTGKGDKGDMVRCTVCKKEHKK